MAGASKTLLATSLVGVVLGAGCIGSIGSIGSLGTITGATVNGDVKTNVDQSQKQQNVNNGTTNQNGGNNNAGQNNAQPSPTPTPDTSSGLAQVSGRIVDGSGKPVVGVAVWMDFLQDSDLPPDMRPIVGKSSVVQTDADGRYTITAQAGQPAMLRITGNPSGFLGKLPSGAFPMQAIVLQGTSGPTSTPTPSPTPTATPSPTGLAISATAPGAGGTSVDPSTTFTLSFSQPMDTGSVEDNFAVYVAGIPGGSYMLSAGVQLPVAYNAVTDTVVSPTSYIYDTSAFTFAWSNNNQNLTATFRPGYRLPADRNPNLGLSYGVSFKGAVRDVTGKSASSGWFPGGKNGVHFSVAADTSAPRLVAVTPISGSPGQLRAQFNETMVLVLGNGTTIPAQGTKQATTTGNYLYRRTVPAAGTPTGTATVADTPTAAAMWDGDATRSTVRLTAASSLNAGETVELQADPAITDPAGNPVETGGNANIKSGIAI